MDEDVGMLQSGDKELCHCGKDRWQAAGPWEGQDPGVRILTSVSGRASLGIGDSHREDSTTSR